MNTPDAPAALTMAVAVLNRYPDVRLRMASGELVAVRSAGDDGQALQIEVPAGRVDVGHECPLVVMDARRAGFLVEGEAIAMEAVDGSLDRVLVAVSSVQRIKSRRVAERAMVQESAVVEGGSDAFDVRLADVSAYGAAFFTERDFAVGDEVLLTLNVEHQVVPAQGQVTNVSPLPHGERRIGCRFTQIAEVHRRLLDTLADRTEAPSDRRAAEPASPLRSRLGATGPASAEASVEAAAPGRHPDPWTMTALYCRACARFTLHHKTSAADAPWACVTCTADATPSIPPDEGADHRAAA
jgi:PilZ domain-containing protein